MQQEARRDYLRAEGVHGGGGGGGGRAGEGEGGGEGGGGAAGRKQWLTSALKNVISAWV